jgi:FdhD protein
LVHKVRLDSSRLAPDHLAVEAPLEIRLDGHRVTTTMRTPGHDFELAAGFCLTDGLLGDADVLEVRYCSATPAPEPALAGTRPASNVVVVDTGCQAPEPQPRITTTTSSCGWCGTAEIDGLVDRLLPLPDPVVFDTDVLASVPDAARPFQELFDTTGAVHAAATFDRAGTIHVVREDIGRHNAVDKVVGQLLLAGGLPARGFGLFVSGRASYELVQKARAAGFSALIAVSAPSSLAVQAARRTGMTLAGFVRPGGLNLYTEAVAREAVSGEPLGRP